MNPLEISKIPNEPGCYLYKDSSGKIIYVGKAKNLKKRVNSYFTKNDLDSKTKALVRNISKIDFIVTNSEAEALLLENNLIKKHIPKYNINLRDSKSYSVIELTDEEFPRLISSRTEKIKERKKNSQVFGPFTSGKGREDLLQTLNKTFKLRTCRKLPRKKCIRYDLGLCSAPCINKISRKDYLEDVKRAIMVLKRKNSELLKNLKEEMKKNSKKKNFEKALLFRDKILAIEYLNEKQNVERSKNYDEDILNYIIKDEKVYLLVFNIHKGILENKSSFEFDFSQKEDFLESFLIQYYCENKIPKRIILPFEVSESVSEALSSKKGSKVEIIKPQRGELHDLLLLVKKNVEIHYFGNMEKVEELKKALSLQFSPKVIECFDISHLSGTEVVAGMVQFRNGKRDKSNYRKFKIKSFSGNDDFRAMNEVVKRRYLRLKKEKMPMPDLVVIDGGAGQLSSSINALVEIGVKIPIISLAKREEEVYFPDGRVLNLDMKNKGLLFLREIRDEVHRFVIKFQRERRSKRFFGKV